MTVTPLLQVCEYRVNEAVGRGDLGQHRIRREELIRRVAGIVSRNLASGRAQRVMALSGGAGEQGSRGPSTGSGSAEEQGDKGAGEQGSRGDFSPSPQSLCTEGGSIEVYIDRVIAGYLREHRRVEALAAGDEPAWHELGKLLAGRAYNMLLRLRVPAARAANEAPDFAQQTCEVVFSQPFPYDVSFDAWATLILKNQILQRYTRSQDLIDREPRVLSLDRPSQYKTGDDFSLYHLLADGSGRAAFERVEVQEWLLQAVAQLRSRPQQQVIVDTFFYELSDDEIAGRLGKTRQAVYNLRHRALRRLRQILETRPFGETQDIA